MAFTERNTDDEIIAVVQAYKAGETIQSKSYGMDEDDWLDIINPIWDFHRVIYRVKPAPIELWGNVYACRYGGQLISTFWTEGAALGCKGNNYIRTAKFREVMDE